MVALLGHTKSLRVHSDVLTEVTCNALLHFTDLRELVLSSVELTEDDFKLFCRCVQQIEVLHIESSCTSEHGMSHISELKNLVELELAHCCFSDSVLKYISRVFTLRRVALKYCHNVTDEGVVFLSALEHLEELQLIKCEKLRGFQSLTRLRNLRRIDLSESCIDDKGCVYVAMLPNLTHLNVRDCRELNGEGFRHICLIRTLRVLWVSLSTSVSARSSYVRIGPSSFARISSLKCLEELRITDDWLSEDTLMCFKGVSSLRKLDLSDVSYLNHLDFSIFPNNLKILE